MLTSLGKTNTVKFDETNYSTGSYVDIRITHSNLFSFHIQINTSEYTETDFIKENSKRFCHELGVSRLVQMKK